MEPKQITTTNAFLDRVVKLVISFISHFQKAAPLILLAFLFSGCVSTKIYAPLTGKLLFATGADAGNMQFTAPGVSFNVTKLNHSKSNKITADAVKTGVTNASGILTTAAILTK